MHASAIDFVTALSAEERCPVCEEPHAAVDQRACEACHARICADCARMRRDAAWLCARCAPPPALDRAQLRWFFPRVPALVASLTVVLALADALHAALRQFVRQVARVRAQLVCAAERELRPRLARLRAAFAFHLAGFLIASAILVAVARAEASRQPR